jgi:hypothetical protein
LIDSRCVGSSSAVAGGEQNSPKLADAGAESSLALDIATERFTEREEARVSCVKIWKK